jgi:hypothetical protein
VVALTIQLHQRGIEVCADLGEDRPEPLDSFTIKDAFAVFCDEHQMNV